MTSRLDISGQEFGRLIVLGRASKGNMWLCRCKCGKEKVIYKTSLISGRTKSCGCLSSEATAARNYRHGEDNTSKEYVAWAGMRQRCGDPGCKSFKDYGARGIAVCDKWLNSFPAFLADMGRAPSPELSLDRIDNNRGYSPENCRWATKVQQANNSRRNHLFTLNGRTQNLGQWCRETGIHFSTALQRMNRYGWTAQDALTTPSRKCHI